MRKLQKAGSKAITDFLLMYTNLLRLGLDYDKKKATSTLC